MKEIIAESSMADNIMTTIFRIIIVRLTSSISSTPFDFSILFIIFCFKDFIFIYYHFYITLQEV